MYIFQFSVLVSDDNQILSRVICSLIFSSPNLDFRRQLRPLHACRKHFGTCHQGKIREILSCDLQLRLYEGRGVRL